MQFSRTLPWLALSLSLCLPHCPGIAQQMAVLNLSAKTAQGTTETGIQKIQLSSSQPVNLSWIGTGETIQKVWLDNPSQVVVDFDGCLSSNATAGGSDGGNGNCTQNGATLIYLRQLAESINFPTGMLPSGNRVNLTVLTKGGEGAKIYQFKLALGSTAPPYGLIQIIPAPPPAPATLMRVSEEYQRTVLAQLSQGLAYAEAKRLINAADPAYAKLRACLALMQQGTAMDAAIAQSGVPRQLVERLRSYSGMSASGMSAPMSAPGSSSSPSAPMSAPIPSSPSPGGSLDPDQQNP